jgi:hypothetical protein
MNDDECKVQEYTKPAQASTSMDASPLEHELECNAFLCFHVQKCSIIAQDHE